MSSRPELEQRPPKEERTAPEQVLLRWGTFADATIRIRPIAVDEQVSGHAIPRHFSVARDDV